MPPKKGPLRPHEDRQTYQRRECLEKSGAPASGDSFLIVTEGEVTEKIYFEFVRDKLKLSQLEVQVVHPSCTDAVGLVRRAIELRESFQQKRRRAYNEVSAYDQVWVLFDTDVPSQLNQLQPALELAKNNNIRVGLSTPSIEVWLLLHFRDRPGPLFKSSEAEAKISEEWGECYEKSKATFMKLWAVLEPNIPIAVRRADGVRKYHEKGGTPSPADPSTDADLLVLELNGSVQEKMRIPI